MAQEASVNLIRAITLSKALNRFGKRLALLVGLFLGLFFIQTATAEAASLYFSPASGSYQAGQTLSVGVYLASKDQAANAIQGTVAFPANKLQIKSISKSGSVMSLWVAEPSFSNSAGTVNFEGIVLNPGYQGAGGKIITITFQAKGSGSATVNFSSGSILANDGEGTDILAGLGSATYAIGGASSDTPPPPDTKPDQSGIPAAPAISSPTHPVQSKWYANSLPTFTWNLPRGVTGVSYIITDRPTSNPGTVSDGLFNSYTAKTTPDGLWYFHLRLKNASGWGPAAHFKFQIDTTAPVPPNVTFPHQKKNYPRPVTLFNTTDSGSGIDNYEVKIGEGSVLKITSDEVVASNPYVLPVQDPGQHTIVVRAYDLAGNYSEGTADFTITALDPPKLVIRYPEIKDNELLSLEAQSYPNAAVTILLQPDTSNAVEEQVLKTNAVGFVNLVWPNYLARGNYHISATVVDSDGGRSLPSKVLTFRVVSDRFKWITGFIANLLSPLIAIVALIFALAFLTWFGWHRFKRFRGRLRQELAQVEGGVHKAFELLRDDVRKQIRLLERVRSKRDLTKEEDKIIKKLREDLDEAEKLVKKEIQKIEKEIE